MIITRLHGGLGNQMFQYAAGLRLASVRRTELKLDLSMLEDPEPVSPDEVAPLVALHGGTLAGWPRRRRGRASPAAERRFHFARGVRALPDGSLHPRSLGKGLIAILTRFSERDPRSGELLSFGCHVLAARRMS